MSFPDPEQRNPLRFPDGECDLSTVFLNQVIAHPNIDIGAFTYLHDKRLPENIAECIAPYLFAGAPERLIIGKFCQIAQGAQFLTASANHTMESLSTYPFAIFDPERLPTYRKTLPRGRDTIVGNDCWIGRQAMFLPGAELGDGVIVGAGAVVGGFIPDYAIVAGNPAQIIRMRFDTAQIVKLKSLAWWHWPIEKLKTAREAIEGSDLTRLLEIHEAWDTGRGA